MSTSPNIPTVVLVHGGFADALSGAARDTFDTLGCMSWSERARRELRASGESSRRRDPAARDQLTAQELQIAQLAAEGLSNREIGERLYLSHRTISTHLYRIFPKLGITARGELQAALSTPTTEQRRREASHLYASA